MRSDITTKPSKTFRRQRGPARTGRELSRPLASSRRQAVRARNFSRSIAIIAILNLPKARRVGASKLLRGAAGAVRCANGRRPEDPKSLRQRNRRRGGRRSGPATRSRSRPRLETRRQAWCSGRGTELAVAAAPQQTSTRARRSALPKRRIAKTIVCRPGRPANVPKPMRQSRRKPPVS